MHGSLEKTNIEVLDVEEPFSVSGLLHSDDGSAP